MVFLCPISVYYLLPPWSPSPHLHQHDCPLHHQLSPGLTQSLLMDLPASFFASHPHPQPIYSFHCLWSDSSRSAHINSWFIICNGFPSPRLKSKSLSMDYQDPYDLTLGSYLLPSSSLFLWPKVLEVAIPTAQNIFPKISVTLSCFIQAVTQ